MLELSHSSWLAPNSGGRVRLVSGQAILQCSDGGAFHVGDRVRVKGREIELLAVP
ncbi:MAG: hypothetical protein HYU76_14740 [Betaproteobacteria bacterium]|nr:hypothetical protein [Betaproteobacteria bacterium]